MKQEFKTVGELLTHCLSVYKTAIKEIEVNPDNWWRTILDLNVHCGVCKLASTLGYDIYHSYMFNRFYWSSICYPQHTVTPEECIACLQFRVDGITELLPEYKDYRFQCQHFSDSMKFIQDKAKEQN